MPGVQFIGGKAKTTSHGIDSFSSGTFIMGSDKDQREFLLSLLTSQLRLQDFPDGGGGTNF